MKDTIKEIKNIKPLYHAKGCTNQDIVNAEKELSVRFSNEYKEYVREYGAISFYGTELSGINVDSSINVVNMTMEERNLNKDFPDKCYVIENLRMDGIVVVEDENGKVYSVQYDKKELICNSFDEYIKMCILRKE